MQPDDQYWRGPDGATPPPAPGQWLGPEYVGPPPMAPPPVAWQPDRVVEPPAPRPLPAQDHAGIDADETRARTLTYGVGIVTGAVLLILLCAICSRTLF